MRPAAGGGAAARLRLRLVRRRHLLVYVSPVFGTAPPLAAIATLLFCAVLAFSGAGRRSSRFLPAGHGVTCAGVRRPRTLTEWARSWVFTGFLAGARLFKRRPAARRLRAASACHGLSLLTALPWRGCWSVAGSAGRRRAAGDGAFAVGLPGLGRAGIAVTVPHGAPVTVAANCRQRTVGSEMAAGKLLTDSLRIYGELMRQHPATTDRSAGTAIPLLSTSCRARMWKCCSTTRWRRRAT